MVIDTSAVITCLFDEPERAAYVAAIEHDPVRMMSLVSFVEASFVVLGRKRSEGVGDLLSFLADADVERVVTDQRQADLAVTAFRRYGKGRHRAGLNIGDCFSYALAKSTGEPLLYKGDDFALTDIVAAWRV